MIEIKSNLSHKKIMDRIFTITLMIVFAGVIVATYSLSEIAGSVPRLISIFGIILCGISLISDISKGNKELKANNTNAKKIEEKKEPTPCYESPDNNQGVPFIKSFGIVISYLVAMVVFGFIVSTLAMLFFMPILLNYKKIKANIIFSVITTAVLYISFTYFLKVQLPVGVLFKLFI